MIGRPIKYKDPMLEPLEGIIVDQRHPYYLWFRTPEIIFNPQGGLYYPDMIVKVFLKDEHGKLYTKFYNTADLPNIKDESLRRKILNQRVSTFKFYNAGLVELVLPYREIGAAINGVTDPYGLIFCSPYVIFAIPFRAAQLIFYSIHDVFTTVMLPVAAVYYTVKAFDGNAEEEPAE